MEAVKPLLTYAVCEQSEGGVSAVIVAAGRSSRMGGVSKTLMNLGSIPVIARTLLAFERAACVKNIVVVTSKEEMLAVEQLSGKYMISKLTDIVVGGFCREESVKRGIERLSADTERVFVHDGARPLVTDRLISSVAEALKTHKAVTCAVPVKDTIKRVENGRVIETLDRSALYSVQTPQGFDLAAFRPCFENADLSRFTDDCSLAESFGIKVQIVEGDYSNIKITTPEDAALAEALLAFRGKNECE